MAIGSFLLIGLCMVAINGEGEEENHQYASCGTGHIAIGLFSDKPASLFEAKMTTWFVHLGLIYFFETGIPFCRQLLNSPQENFEET
jgi:hypothetical protein